MTRKRDPDDLRRRLRDGENVWVTPGELAEVLDVDRSTAARLITMGAVRYRLKTGTGRHREAHPDDVRRVMAQRGEIYRDEPPPAG